MRRSSELEKKDFEILLNAACVRDGTVGGTNKRMNKTGKGFTDEPRCEPRCVRNDIKRLSCKRPLVHPVDVECRC